MHGVVIELEQCEQQQLQLGIERRDSDHADPFREGEQHGHGVAVHGVVVELEQQLSTDACEGQTAEGSLTALTTTGLHHGACLATRIGVIGDCAAAGRAGQCRQRRLGGEELLTALTGVG